MWKVSSAAWASLEVVEPDFAVEVYPARRAFKIALAISLAGSCITRRGIERTPESADGARNRESSEWAIWTQPLVRPCPSMAFSPIRRTANHSELSPILFSPANQLDGGASGHAPAVGQPPRGTPGGTLDQAPLSQEYFSVPDNYLGPKKPIGITILPQCPISGQFFHSPWRLLMVLGFDSLRI